MSDFIYFCKITFSNYIANVILASEILQKTKVLQQLKPLLQRASFITPSVSSACGQNNGFINISDNYTLLKIQIWCCTTSELTTKDNGLSRSLEWYQIHLAVFDIQNLASRRCVVKSLELIQFAFEKDEVSFLWWFEGILLDEVYVQHVFKVLELLHGFLRWEDELLNI